MFATQVLPEDSFEETSKTDNNSEIVGFLSIDNKNYKILRGENNIGRDPSLCSVVLEHFTVSKHHAVIESEGSDDTFIYDVGSTNQTKLGKKSLKPHCRYKIDDGSVITFGNVVAKFIVSCETEGGSKSYMGTTSPPSSGENMDLNMKNSFDIFDVATQIEPPQNLPQHFKIFKVPMAQPKNKELSPQPSTSYFNPVTDVISADAVSKPNEQYFFGLEDSNIYSLSTQCQLPDPSLDQEKESLNENPVVNRPSDGEKIKSLLNDGQDDILCSFMSIHSPNSLLKKSEIKTEVSSEENLREVSKTSQAPQEGKVETLNENINVEKVIEESNKNTSLIDKETGHTNDCVSPIRNVSQNSNESFLEITLNETDLKEDEDLIATQKFSKVADIVPETSQATSIISHQKEILVVKQQDLSVKTEKNLDIIHKPSTIVVDESSDEETQAYFNPLEESFTQRNKDDDFVSTQVFNSLTNDREKEKSSVVGTENFTSRSNDDDFVTTQAFNPESTDKMKEKSKSVVLNESFTQRSKDDDFVSTQAFNPESDDKIKEKSRSVGLNESFTLRNKDDDLESTQDFNPKTSEKIKGKPRAAILNESFSQRSKDDDFVSTQVFISEAIDRKKTKSTAGNDHDDEDFIATQKLESPKNNVKEKFDSRESSPDLLSLRFSPKDLEDVTGTQIFAREEQESPKPVGKDKCPEPCIIESSGDETESDLEILNDKDELQEFKINFNLIKKEKDVEECMKDEDAKLDNQNESFLTVAPENTNYSYVFEVDGLDSGSPEKVQSEKFSDAKPCSVELTDSDETDCEEIESNLKTPLRCVKKENEDGVSSSINSRIKESEISDSEPLSRPSVKMPLSQDIEASLQKLLKNAETSQTKKKKNNTSEEKELGLQPPSKVQRIEVGINRCNFLEKKHTKTILIDECQAKRGRSNESLGEVTPSKKPKVSDGIQNKEGQVSDQNEDKLSKLWKAHDFAQIQPSRTRNSLVGAHIEKLTNVLGNNNFNKPQTSYRKSNGQHARNQKDEIPLGTCDEVRKHLLMEKFEIPSSQDIPMEPKYTEIKPTRILRSSRRSSGDSTACSLFKSPLISSTANRTLDNRLRRSCRSKIDSYFTRTSINIVFTGFECETLQKVITDLGGRKTNDLFSADVLVTDRVRRTVKFLCAVGMGIPITSPDWLVACKKEKKFIDPWNYLLKKDCEDWDFDLKTSLERSKKKKLLKGFNVFATESTKPPVNDLLTIVESCGGTPLFNRPDVWPKKTIFVTCLEDKDLWPVENLRYVKLVHYEFILSGVLKQQLDFRTYKLRKASAPKIIKHLEKFREKISRCSASQAGCTSMQLTA